MYTYIVIFILTCLQIGIYIYIYIYIPSSALHVLLILLEWFLRQEFWRNNDKLINNIYSGTPTNKWIGCRFILKQARAYLFAHS